MAPQRQSTFSSLARRANVAMKSNICAPELFHAILHHERARVDRDGAGFSLVVCPVDSGIRLIQLIRKVMRSIDEVGFLDANTIGVLLPATTLEGGQAFARRVSTSFDSASAVPSFKVYSYPLHWLPHNEAEKQSDVSGDVRFGTESRPELPEVLERVFRKRIPGWKRVLDITGSIAACLLFTPLFLIISVYIKLVSPGPILFRQQRVGYRGRTFMFMKFRTMRCDNNQNAHKDHIVAAIRSGMALEKLDDKGDSRIIPGGRILRKTCLDEFPQLINVLRGEMSLVGPRPCMPYEADEFLRWHTHRFDVLPGMTGLWQVSGKNKLTFCQMVRLDISYAEHMSFWRDVRILIMTLPAIIKMVFEAIAGKLSAARAADAGENADEVLNLQGRTS